MSSSSSISFEQAQNILAAPAARCAYLVDAVLAAVQQVNTFKRFPLARAFRVVFTSVKPTQVRFCVYQNSELMGLLTYRYNPDTMAGPELTQTTDKPHGELLVRLLRAPADAALCHLEKQVWGKVSFEAESRPAQA